MYWPVQLPRLSRRGAWATSAIVGLFPITFASFASLPTTQSNAVLWNTRKVRFWISRINLAPSFLIK